VAIVESDLEKIQDDNSVTIVHNDVPVNLRKAGLYRFETDPALLRVYSGEAVVMAASGAVKVKGSREIALDAPVAAAKFDSRKSDALTRWSRRRAETIAMASMSASKSLLDRGTSWSQGGWYFNPYFGLVTYIPGAGVFRTPFGFALYAPSRIQDVYYRPAIAAPSAMSAGASGLGSYGRVPQASGGYSGVIASGGVSSRSAAPAPAAAAAPAPAPAPVSRESGRVGGAR
jgi:hypothetical protein